MSTQSIRNELQILLKDALALVGNDARRVVARLGFGYESQIETRQALVLGGAPTPRYLRRSPTAAVALEAIPYTLSQRSPRLLLTPVLGGEIDNDWLGFLESLIQEDEELLILAGEAEDSPVLQTLIVNFEKEVVRVAVAGLGEHGIEDLSARIQSATGAAPDHFSVAANTAPDDHVRIALPIADYAYVRQNSTLVFPEEGQDWGNALEEVAVIYVGGRDVDDQAERLESLADALRSS